MKPSKLGPANNRAILICRVSSEKQRENYSIPQQERRGREYAQREGLIITRVSRIVESASKPGRKQWEEYLDQARNGPETHIRDSTNLFNRAHFLKAASDILKRPIGPGAAPLDADFAQALRSAAPQIRGWLREDAGKAWGNCYGFRCTTAFKCELAVCTLETKRGAGDALSMTLTYDYHE